MRYLLSLVVSVLGAVAVLACSDDEPADKGTSGTIAPIGDGEKSGDDDDDLGKPGDDCSGVKALDCAKQTAHAKEANCAKFDAAKYEKNCESMNCATIVQCAGQQKALGDCLLEVPAVCKDDDVSTETPVECKDKDQELFDCFKRI